MKKEPKDIWKPGTEVTPEDIRAAREAAIAEGADREELERAHAELVEEFGSEEKLAEEWMKQAWRNAFREQLGQFGRQSPGAY